MVMVCATSTSSPRTARPRYPGSPRSASSFFRGIFFLGPGGGPSRGTDAEDGPRAADAEHGARAANAEHGAHAPYAEYGAHAKDAAHAEETQDAVRALLADQIPPGEPDREPTCGLSVCLLPHKASSRWTALAV